MAVKANIRAEQKLLDQFEHCNNSPSNPTLFAIQLAGILGASFFRRMQNTLQCGVCKSLTSGQGNPFLS
jgi:hypothetical protein